MPLSLDSSPRVERTILRLLAGRRTEEDEGDWTMRTLLVGLMAANGMVLGDAETSAAQARGRSVERVSFEYNASAAPDRYRGQEDGRAYYDDDEWDDRYDDRWDDDGWDGGRDRNEYVETGRVRGKRAEPLSASCRSSRSKFIR